ncbi:hypothetical protein GF406_06905 [candidate division KSB1 bacterium]|nr:hypothetical protein [candidate division KSB1 bacterium]
MKHERFTRREFLKSSAVGVASLSAASILSSCSDQESTQSVQIPKRVLGKTGLEIPVLSFGGGSQFMKNEDGDWEKMMERALELGINYFDTASSYAYRKSLHSEERFARILAPIRDKVIISTKFDARDVDGMMKEVETSLKQLETDYIDILMIHSIEKSEDIDALDKGVYAKMRQLKEQGVARFLGFSSMNSAEKSKEFIEKLDPDACILAMNPTKYGDFAEVALPAARAKNTGVIAMKVMRNLVGVDGTTARELMQYAITKPGVSSAVIGHFGMDILEENAVIVNDVINDPTVRKLSSPHSLETRLAKHAGPQTLCWARAGYQDNTQGWLV